MKSILQNIPTNIITGFLGVGKTTAILELLQNKPEQETWAVLVNEFGQIGIDGQILKKDGVAIKEIPGGCMCCATGPSMQISLNALVAHARPDHILIEPTGIGHPKQILKQLRQTPFDQLLDMRACICLVDPRHLQDERYLTNEIYKQQLEIADVLVANKTDLCSEADRHAFDELVRSQKIQESGWIDHGKLDPSWLSLPHAGQQVHRQPLLHSTVEFTGNLNEIRLEENETFRRLENNNNEYFSCGWLITDKLEFNFQCISDVLEKLEIERVKAALHTNQGFTIFNGVPGNTTVNHVQHPLENRIELISLRKHDWVKIEEQILSCCLRA